MGKVTDYLRDKFKSAGSSAFEAASTADLRVSDSMNFSSFGFNFSKLANLETDTSVLSNVLKQGEGAFKTFGGQAGYSAGRIGTAINETVTRQFLKNSAMRGGFKGAALGVVAGVAANAFDRWLSPLGSEDNGVIHGTQTMLMTAGLGALGGFASTASTGILSNIKSSFSGAASKSVFNLGKEGNFGARTAAFAGRRLGGSIFMGAAALGASAYIGGKVLKSIVSTNLTQPANQNDKQSIWYHML